MGNFHEARQYATEKLRAYQKTIHFRLSCDREKDRFFIVVPDDDLSVNDELGNL